MKKLLNVLWFCVLVIACKQSPNEFKVTLSGLSVTDDIYVYDAISLELIDSIKIVDGGGTYTFGNVTEPKLLTLKDNKNFMRSIIAENGHVTIVGDTGTVTGTDLNDRLTEFSLASGKIVTEVSEKRKAILGKAEKEERQLNKEEYAILDSLDKEQINMLISIMKQCYLDNKDNFLGALQLSYYQFLVPEEEFMILYEQGGEVVKNYPPFVQLIKEKGIYDKTQAGGKYVDIEGVNPNDTTQTLKLSDYVGKHKYVLLDFWASWCGPCKDAMPELKKLKEKYSSKELEIIGIVVFDKLEAHLASMKELNLTWAQIFDNKNTMSAMYSIKGVPTLILLDEDGTILLRTYQKDEVKEKLESLLGK